MLEVRIDATGEPAHLCDECDALWPDGVPIVRDRFVDFSTYVKPLGLNGTWSEITVIKRTDTGE